MLCIDTSSMIAFLEGASGRDIDWVDHALSEQIGAFSPVTLTELLSDPKLPPSVRKLILDIPLLSLTEGFWQRIRASRSGGLRTPFRTTNKATGNYDHELLLRGWR